MDTHDSPKQQTRLIPVTKWNEHHQWPPVGGMRHLIFFAEKNGFEKVIRRCGRRVLRHGRTPYSGMVAVRGLPAIRHPKADQRSVGAAGDGLWPEAYLQK